MATTNIKTMKELVDTTAAPTSNNLQTFYPKTHEKAVVDDNGNTLDSKLAAIIEDAEGAATAAANVVKAQCEEIKTQTEAIKTQTEAVLDNGAVRTDIAQSLSDTQKAQALANVGIAGIDDEPTAGSEKLVKSGGIQNELALGAVYDVSAKNPTAGPNSDGKWESLSALLSDANLNTLIPTAVRKGGMSIKFIQSSDNKYIQARCMAQNFTTDVTQWQGVDENAVFESKNLISSGGAFSSVLNSVSYGENPVLLDVAFVNAPAGGKTAEVVVKENEEYIFVNGAESTVLYYIGFLDENNNVLGGTKTCDINTTRIYQAPSRSVKVSVSAFRGSCYIKIQSKSLINTNKENIDTLDKEQKETERKVNSVMGLPLLDSTIIVGSSIVHKTEKIHLPKNEPLRVEVTTNALSKIALYFFDASNNIVQSYDNILVSEFPKVFTPLEDIESVKISVNSTSFIIQPGDANVFIYGVNSLKENIEKHLNVIDNAIFNPTLCEGSFSVSTGKTYNKLYDCKIQPFKQVALFVNSNVVQKCAVSLIAEDNTIIFPVGYSASENFKIQASPFVFRTANKSIKSVRIAIWSSTFIIDSGSVDFSLREISNMLLVENGICITDTLNLTSASSAQIAYDKTTGLVGVASMGGWKVYGETRDKIILDIFSPENPTEIRHKILISKGDTYGGGYVYNSTTDLDIVLVSSGIWRVIINGYHGFMYIDYNYNTDTISEPVEIMASIAGELVYASDANRRAYCTSKGYADTTSTNQTISSNFYQDGNGRIYGCWTAESPNERTSYPVCFYSDDNMETIVPFAVYPVDCNYEASVVMLNDVLYLLERKYDDTYSYGISNDNGETWNVVTLDVGSDNRPRLYNFGGTLYWCYGLFSQYTDVRYGKRTRIIIKIGNDITQAKDIYIESPNGVVYFCLMKIYNELYLIYSSAPLRLDVANGVRDNSWGKDAVFIKKIDI